MKTIIVTITTAKNISTVQIKCGNIFIVENTAWSEKAKFPFKALLKGFYKVIRRNLRGKIAELKNKIITKIIEV